MPSGPEHFVSDPAYLEELNRARELLLTHRQRWRVIYHYDGDGIASASCALRSLERLAYPSQATALFGVESSRLDELLTATRGPVLLVDTGSTWLDRVARHPHPVVVLDHHKYPGAPRPPSLPEHVAFVNPLDWGVDGMSELCAASLTWLFTVFIDPRNWDNAAWGLSGVIADRQHQAGLHGLNARLIEEAVSRSLLERRIGIGLFGATLLEALTHSIDPFARGLSGRPEAVEPFLRDLSIDASKNPLTLTPEEETRLVKAIAERLQSQGTRPEFVHGLRAERWAVPSLGRDAEEISNLQNACGRAGAPAIGLGLALGDTASWNAAQRAERDWREGILLGLRRLEDHGTHLQGAIQWFESPEGPLAGTQAGLALTYFLDSRRPVFVFTRDGDRWRISGRGTLWLVSQGLDLSEVCREAAGTVGGEGGGHKVASGATIPADTREEFLSHAEGMVGRQLGAAFAEAAV
ncbi:MAG: DHH family phosphoesterase [Thermoplasmata archaeon]